MCRPCRPSSRLGTIGHYDPSSFCPCPDRHLRRRRSTATPTKCMRLLRISLPHEGAHVVVFPEMTLTGYPIEDLALRRTFRQGGVGQGELDWRPSWRPTDWATCIVAVGTVGTDRASDKPRNRTGRACTTAWSGPATTSISCRTTACSTSSASSRPATAPSMLDIDGVAHRRGDLRGHLAGRRAGRPSSPTEHIDVLLTMNGSPYEEGKTHTRYDLAVSVVRPRSAPR